MNTLPNKKDLTIDVLDRLVTELAKAMLRDLVEAVIADLKQSTHTLSDDLERSWHEICVQVQGQETASWDAYVALINDATRKALTQRTLSVQKALSLITDAGMEWLEAPDDHSIPIFEEEVLDLVRAKVLTAASKDATSSVQRFLSARR